MPDDIGRLRHRVELQTRASTPNATTGGLDETFTTVATVWARVDALSGGRYLASQQVDDVTTHTITLRWRSDWPTIKYCRFDSRRFRVKTARDLDAEKRFLEFSVEELKSGV